MKFPIYRPRGEKAPEVSDDINAVWEDQIRTMDNRSRSGNVLLDSRFRSTSKTNTYANGDDIAAILSEREARIQ